MGSRFERLALLGFRLRARRVLDQLRSEKYPKLRAMGDALHEAFTQTFSPEVQSLIRQIEQRRSALLHSGQQIRVIDYGVDAPESQRSQEQMRKGVASTA